MENRLASITNTASGSQTYNYGYDNNGNVTSDQYRDISGITYNISNLPEQIVKGSLNIKYWYDNNGNRIRKQEGSTDEVYVLGLNGETEAVFNADGTIKFFNINTGKETIGRFAPTPVDLYLANTTLSGTYEAQNSITVESNVTVSGTATLKAGNSIHLKPGFTASSGNNFTAKIGTVSSELERFYYIKDHLGSIRVTTDETGTVVSAQDYFSYGELLREYNSIERYKFTEKERDKETEYDYFGARYYDSELGRWLLADPFADLSSSISPYAYCFNNPLNFTDPDGMWPWDDPNYIWDPEFGWRLRGIDEFWAITGWEKLDRFSAEYSTTAQIMPFPLNPVAPPIVGPMESLNQVGKNIINLFDKLNEEGARIEVLKLLLATYITNLVLPTNLETRKSGKEKASNIPSWAEGTKPLPGESGKEYAKRLCDSKYGPGNYDTGPASEYNKLKKYGDRSRK